MTHAGSEARRGRFRWIGWRDVALAAGLGLVAVACEGPSRGSFTQPSSGTHLFVDVTASPNTLRGANAATEEAQGGCATIQVVVYDTSNRLVDGQPVAVTTTLGRFPATTARPESVGVSGVTLNGVFTDVLCAKSERGTAIVTATAQDAHATVLITIF